MSKNKHIWIYVIFLLLSYSASGQITDEQIKKYSQTNKLITLDEITNSSSFGVINVLRALIYLPDFESIVINNVEKKPYLLFYKENKPIYCKRDECLNNLSEDNKMKILSKIDSILKSKDISYYKKQVNQIIEWCKLDAFFNFCAQNFLDNGNYELAFYLRTNSYTVPIYKYYMKMLYIDANHPVDVGECSLEMLGVSISTLVVLPKKNINKFYYDTLVFLRSKNYDK